LSFERRVRVARLPEMRLAYIDRRLPGPPSSPEFTEALAGLWDEFNDWRLRHRPALGRIDIAAVGWMIEDDEGMTYRTAVPVRSDYDAPAPARTTFFPGGLFAYCYADDADEIGEALELARGWVEANGWRPKPGGIELYKFHYNLEQHPADCGFLVERLDGGKEPERQPSGPLRIARE
jgi:hypothetical protein